MIVINLQILVNIRMIRRQDLSQKQCNIPVCSHCRFHQTAQQLFQHTVSSTIFQLQWTCSYCHHHNHITTDQYFKYYAIGNNQHNITMHTDTQINVDQLVPKQGEAIWNQDIKQDHGVCVMIDVGMDMGDQWAYLDNKRESQYTLQSVVDRYPMLAKYLQMLAVSKRLQRGKYFSWADFLKRKVITKIQFALMITDYLYQIRQNVSKQFFIFDPNHEINVRNLQNISMVSSKFLEKIGHRQPVRTLEQIICSFSSCHSGQSLVIISASPLHSIAKYLQKAQLLVPKIILINLQSLTNSITLLPTSSSTYLSLKENAIIHFNSTSLFNTNTNANTIFKDSFVNNCSQIKNNDTFGSNEGEKNEWKSICAKLIILDFRIGGVRVMEALESVNRVMLAKDCEIVVFGFRAKNGEQGKWQKIIQKQKYGQYLQLHPKKHDKTMQNSRLSVSQKSKIWTILHRFDKICNPIDTNDSQAVTTNQLQQLLETIQHYIGNKYSQLRAYLSYHSYNVQKQLDGNKKYVRNVVLWKNCFKTHENKTNKKDQYEYFWKKNSHNVVHKNRYKHHSLPSVFELYQIL